MFADLLNRECVITQRSFDGAEDRDGNITATVTTATTVCELQQQHRAETVGTRNQGAPPDRGEVAVSDWLLIVPAGTDLRHVDSVTVDGETFELIGEPWAARNPRTATESHIEATVRRSQSTGDA